MSECARVKPFEPSNLSTTSVQGLTPSVIKTQAGASGSGKTTFIHNLAALYGRQDGPGSAPPATQQLPPQQSSGASNLVDSFTTKPTTLLAFKDAPDSLCTQVLFTDEATKTHYRMLIQAGILACNFV